MNTRSIIHSALLAVLLLQARSSRADITGMVHNQTTGKPAAGNEVVLLRLGEGMQEQGRTRSDEQGAFTFATPVATAQYVVRVLHQGVNYDLATTASSSPQINVYDAVDRIPGMAGTIGMAQVESDGKFLKVTEMYAIRNASNPPVTQANAKNFVVTLPAKGVLDSAEVRSGEGMWLKAPVAEIKGPGRQFAINLPMRPGDTLYKFIYHLPYEGPTSFHLKLAYPIQKFAVMHPPSMTFRALQPRKYVTPGVANNLTIEKAVSEPLAGDVPAFMISGVGVAPPLTVPAVQATPAPAALSAAKANGSAKTGELTNAQASRQAWLILAGIAVALALSICAFWYFRSNPAAARETNAKEPLLDALKEELFKLENEKLHGSISAEEYKSTKQALNVGIRRALARNKS